MEGGIGTISEDLGQVTVLQEVLNVGHLMMHTNQTPLVDIRTDFHSEIVTIAKVPGGGFTQYSPVQGLLENGVSIEFRTHGRHVDGGKELLGQLEHQLRRVALLHHSRRDIDELATRIRYQNIQHIGPRLAVHVAQNVRGNRSYAVNTIRTIVVPQLPANVGVQGLVEGPYLLPHNVHILAEVTRLVTQIPVLSAIGDICK